MLNRGDRQGREHHGNQYHHHHPHLQQLSGYQDLLYNQSSANLQVHLIPSTRSLILIPQILCPPWCLASRGEHHQVQAEGSRARREQLSCADADKYSRHTSEGGQLRGDEPSVWSQVWVGCIYILSHCLFVDYLFA